MKQQGNKFAKFCQRYRKVQKELYRFDCKETFEKVYRKVVVIKERNVCHNR